MASSYSKPAVRHAWAELASGTDLVDPGDSYAQNGWLIGVKPPRQYDNWFYNYVMGGIRYFMQAGIVDYDAAENYPLGGIARGPDGLLYRSLVANNSGHTPASSPAQWGAMQAFTPSSSDNGNSVATTAFVHNNFLPVTSTIGVLPGQLVNGQVPLGVVQQWQGSLAIAFSQLVGTISNAQVPSAAVTQWHAALSIAWSQITGTKNADQLEGQTTAPPGAFGGNQIAVYGPVGDLFARYFNSSAGNNENPPLSQFMVTNGSDNYLRKAGLAYIKTSLGIASVINGAQMSATMPGGLIIKSGSFIYSGSGAAGIAFSSPFPSTCTFGFGAAAIGGYQPGTQLLFAGGIDFDMTNLGGTRQTIYWFAIGF